MSPLTSPSYERRRLEARWISKTRSSRASVLGQRDEHNPAFMAVAKWRGVD
jgi:hypothetical protein